MTPRPPRPWSGTASVAALGSDVVSLAAPAGTFADKNAGTGKTVNVTGFTLTGSDAGNYNIVQPTGLTATINKASLTPTGGVTVNSKVYDGTTVATVSGAASVTAPVQMPSPWSHQGASMTRMSAATRR
jgi:hypothetical protein